MGLVNKVKRGVSVAIAFCVLLSMSGCYEEDSTTMNDDLVAHNPNFHGDYDEKGRMIIDGNFPIEDNKAIYENWEPSDVEDMYVCVSKGNKKENTDHTWKEINTYSTVDYAKKGIERYKVEGLLQIGDGKGIDKSKFGGDDIAPNCTVCVRGQTSSKRPQKGYKIKINKNAGDWNGQTVINLNKHAGETVRFRNMLAYKLMEDVDGMFSARTKFVHLYVKDNTVDTDKEKYEDYGLYTYVEQIGKGYLEEHGLDANGQLYKMNLFEFFRYEDNINVKSDSKYNKHKFEDLLEIKGDDDHSKLIAMLEELNDYSIPIEDTFAKWFDEDNIFTWLAFHMLIGNSDTQSRNAFLYSPKNIDKFYFISWDNDGSFIRKEREIIKKPVTKMSYGVSNYWGNVLFSRVIKNDEYRKKLDKKVDEVKNELPKEKVSDLVEKYDNIVKKYLFNLPDIVNIGISKEQRKEVVDSMASEIDDNYQIYKDSIKGVMPFFLGVPKKADKKDGLTFGWSDSYSFEKNLIKYDFTVAKDLDFTDVVEKKKDLLDIHIDTKKLPAGKYYYKVVAKDDKGNTMTPYDQVILDNRIVYGVKCFYIEKDGSIKDGSL